VSTTTTETPVAPQRKASGPGEKPRSAVETARFLRGCGAGDRHCPDCAGDVWCAIYVRKEIVHNRFVVNELAEKGAIFVDDIHQVPEGARVIYSAHGVSPAVREQSKNAS